MTETEPQNYSENYFQQEDEPDMSNPDVALDMYQSQKATLPTLEQVHETVQQVQAQLQDIYNTASANNLPDVAKKAEKIWRRTEKLHLQIQQQDATLRGGEAVIAAVTDQRDAIVNEMEELLGAINMGDESHPKLADWASEIRDDEREYQEAAAEEYAMDYAWENVAEESQSIIGAVLQRHGFTRARAYHYAGCVYEVFNGDLDLTDEQVELLKQLVVKFELPDYVLKTEAREAQMDAESAQRYREAEIRAEQQKRVQGGNVDD